MTAFCAVTVEVTPTILIFPDCPVKKILSLANLRTNLREIDQAEWCAVLFDQIFKRNTMKSEIAISQIEPLLGEIVGLINQIKICVLHGNKSRVPRPQKIVAKKT